MQLIELLGILAVYIPAIIIAHTYRKKAAAPIKWGKIVVVFFIGLFTLTIPLEFFGQYHELAIFPLGAFIFFIFTRKSRWHTYRPFIWLGFFAKYVFFVVSIVTIPIENFFYPPDELTTYVKSVDEAYVITSHIVGEAAELTPDAQTLLASYSEQRVKADEWTYDYAETQFSYTDEEFPYMLANVEAPFGMTEPFTIYVNKTGDGLLVLTEKHHVYFNITSPILTFGGEGDA